MPLSLDHLARAVSLIVRNLDIPTADELPEQL
jgi:hypothetical protein